MLVPDIVVSVVELSACFSVDVVFIQSCPISIDFDMSKYMFGLLVFLIVQNCSCLH